MYGCICICYACQCLYVVMHALLWVWFVLHEVIVCILGHHDVVGCYDVDLMAKIEQEIQITKVRLQH